jgi:hypothetical protein
MTRLDFPFPQIATGDLDIPIIGQLPVANLPFSDEFRALSCEDGRLRGTVEAWGLLE